MLRFNALKFVLLLANLLTPTLTQAQVVPDNTLPVDSTASVEGNTFAIEGGTRHGQNLFHSFEQFSVPTGATALFNNAVDIDRIISRVTGSSISNIDGLIRASGRADLFLLNPNGIVFGENAQLDMGGSFIGTSARGIQFADGTAFEASPTGNPLLTVSVPVGLQFARTPGGVTVNAQTPGLRVDPGQTLALIGGEVKLNNGILTAQSGTIALGAVGENSGNSPSVSLTQTGTGWQFGYDGVGNFADIRLSGRSVVDASGIGGGEIRLRGRHVTLTNEAALVANTLGNRPGRGIAIAAETFSLQENAAVSTITLGSGAAGNLSLEAAEIVELRSDRPFSTILFKLLTRAIEPNDLRGGLFTVSFGTGDAGDISIQADRLLLDRGAAALSTTAVSGAGGDIEVSAGEWVRLSDAGLVSGTATPKASGDIAVTTGRLQVLDGALIGTATLGQARSGNIDISASESVELVAAENITVGEVPGLDIIGFGISSLSSLSLGSGAGGNIHIKTRRLSIRDGANLDSGTFARGDGGNIAINASEMVEVADFRSLDTSIPLNSDNTYSVIMARSGGTGNAGDISIDTRRLVVRGGGQIQTIAFNSGSGGNLDIRASESIDLIGSSTNSRRTSGLYSSASSDVNRKMTGTGDAGNIRIETGELSVRDGAQVSVRSVSDSQAGNIDLQVDRLLLDRGILTAETRGGNSGNIDVRSRQIRLQNRSQIRTNTGNSIGGNITIDTDTLTAFGNSDITANAIRGTGGRVTIDALGIFGTRFRPHLTPRSDITATSDLGAQFDGLVELKTPDLDPQAGLVQLATRPTEPPPVVGGCQSVADAIQLVYVGRGGLPPDPAQVQLHQPLWEDWRPLQRQRGGVEPETQLQSNRMLVEAEGWVRRADGRILLISESPAATPANLRLNGSGCHHGFEGFD